MLAFLPLLPGLSLFLGGFLLLVPWDDGRIAKWPAIFFSGLALASAGLLLFYTGPMHPALLLWEDPGKGMPQIQVSYHIDGLYHLFTLTGAATGFCILLFAAFSRTGNDARFLAFLLLAQGSAYFLFLAGDLLLLYATWELLGLSSALLLLSGRRRGDTGRSAMRLFISTHIAGYALLLGALLLGRANASFQYTAIASATITPLILLLFLVAAVAKAIQYPLHTWLHSGTEAPAPTLALIYGVLPALAGLYLLARLSSLSGEAFVTPWSQTLVLIGSVSMVVGAFLALQEREPRKMLSLATTSQIGHSFLGLGLGSLPGMGAALLHTLNLALFQGGLFLWLGLGETASGRRAKLSRQGPLRGIPWESGIFLVLVASLGGLPLLTNGFASRWMLHNAAIEGGYALYAAASLLAGGLTLLRLIPWATWVFSSETVGNSSGRKLSTVAVGVLAGLCLLFGIVPWLPLRWLIDPAVGAMVKPLGEVRVPMSGTLSPSGLWIALLTLAMTLAIAAAALLRTSPWAPGVAAAETLEEDPPTPPPTKGTRWRFLSWIVDPTPLYASLGYGILRLAVLSGRFASTLEHRHYAAVALLAALSALLLMLY